jgi:hypothetical protein
LSYSELPIWPEARNFFGNSIQIFSSFEEAIELSKAFLAAPYDKYTVKNLQVNDSANFMEILSSLEK